MAYSEKKKNEVIDLYESGIAPWGDCQEGRDLTFDDWLLDAGDRLREALLSHLCALQEAERRLNIQQEYCSKGCKNAAAYRRSRQQVDGTATAPQQCSHCGGRYTPKHGNALSYCSKRCRTQASNQRRKAKLDLIAAEQAAEQGAYRSEATRHRPLHCDLKAARKADIDTSRIDRIRYSEELDTLSRFMQECNPTQVQLNVIQDLIKSVR